MKKIILPAVFIIIAAVFVLPGFLVRVKIECRSQFGECPTDVRQALSEADNKSFYSAKKIIEKKAKSNFLVSNFTVQFKLPNILRINLLVKKPFYAVTNSGGVFDLVENEGIVVAQASNTALPYVTVSGDLPSIGQNVGEKYLLALKLIDGLNKMYQTSFGVVETDTLLVDLPPKIRVIFPLVGYSREMLLGSLRLIYSNIQNGENGNSYSQIDLRYRNPVLR